MKGVVFKKKNKELWEVLFFLYLLKTILYIIFIFSWLNYYVKYKYFFLNELLNYSNKIKILPLFFKKIYFLYDLPSLIWSKILYFFYKKLPGYLIIIN